MPRESLHLNPLTDLLGVLVMMLVPTFSTVDLRGLKVSLTGSGAVEDCAVAPFCRPVPLKIDLSPTRLTLRLHESSLLRFAFSFDRHGRPDLWPLGAELARVRDAYPDMPFLQLDVDDEVEVELLIAVADFCVGAGFPIVFVAPARTSDDLATAE